MLYNFIVKRNGMEMLDKPVWNDVQEFKLVCCQ